MFRRQIAAPLSTDIAGSRSALTPPLASISSILRYVWRDLRLLILLGVVSLALALCVRYIFDYPIPLAKLSIDYRARKILRYAALLGPLILAGGLVRHWWMLRGTDGRRMPGVAGSRMAWRTLRKDTLAARAALAMTTALLMIALLAIFAVWKASIPVLSPWHWDATLLAVERVLHGGVLPQDITRQWFGPAATAALDNLYYLWFRLLALFIVWQAFRAPSFSRTRTLLTVVLAYTLLGNVTALLLSSGGPVYYDRLVGLPNPYAEHAAYLASIPGLHATVIQQAIWDWLQTSTYVPFGSISAMPSMHVAVATVIALACWERHRWLGVAGWVYVLLILLGSVQLNWHYAIDGYVSIIGTLAIWWLSGWLVGRYA